ncbi:MAG: NosD domain-containing protein [Nitrospirota bacterium]
MNRYSLVILSLVIFLSACNTGKKDEEQQSGGGTSTGSGGGTGGSVTPPVTSVVNIPPSAGDNFDPPLRTFYVATNGNDSNPGTEAQPWKTLQHAVIQVIAGDLVLVQNGTYSGFNTNGGKNGTAQAPIIFKANGINVTINVRNSNTPDNINVENTNFVVIDGFIVPNAERAGIRVAESKGVIVKNNRVGPSGKWGIFTGFAPEIKIRNNKVFGSKVEHGIYVSNSHGPNDNPVISGNESYGNHFSGIQVNGDCDSGGDGVISGALIEGNILRNNDSKAFSLISMQESVVRNNLIYNNGIVNGSGGIHLTDEVGAGCNKPSNNNVIVNNTIIEPRISGISITDNAKGNVIFNNVIITTQRSPISDEVGGNLNHIDAASNFTLQGAIPANFFVDASGNYHLKNGSPAIDAGKPAYQEKSAPTTDFEAIIARPQGPAIDLGAYEYTP